MHTTGSSWREVRKPSVQREFLNFRGTLRHLTQVLSNEFSNLEICFYFFSGNYIKWFLPFAGCTYAQQAFSIQMARAHPHRRFWHSLWHTGNINVEKTKLLVLLFTWTFKRHIMTVCMEFTVWKTSTTAKFPQSAYLSSTTKGLWEFRSLNSGTKKSNKLHVFFKIITSFFFFFCTQKAVRQSNA